MNTKEYATIIQTLDQITELAIGTLALSESKGHVASKILKVIQLYIYQIAAQDQSVLDEWKDATGPGA